MQDIHPARPPVVLPLLTEIQKAVLFVIIGVILILIAWKIGHWISKRYLKQEKKKEIPSLPPRDIEKETREKLAQIYPLIQKEEFHQFYLKITEIVRQYMTDKYTINVIDMTTQETKQSTRIHDTMGESSHAFLVTFLTTVDAVKFTRTDTDITKAKKLYETVVIQLTSQERIA